MKGLNYVRILALSGALTAVNAAYGAPLPLNLTGWEVEQYDYVDDAAQWHVSGNTVAAQSINADASILHGGVESSNRIIEGTFEVSNSSDDDFVGFVFGYQNPEQYYLFDWKGQDQYHPDSGAFGEQGMSVKVVDTTATGGGDPSGDDLWTTGGNENVTSLYHNTIGWEASTEYAFELIFTAGHFGIEIYEGDLLLSEIMLDDGTYLAGEFGFYNFSQGGALYSASVSPLLAGTPAPNPSGPSPDVLADAPLNPEIETVPEPITLGLLTLGLIGLGHRRWNFHRAT